MKFIRFYSFLAAGKAIIAVTDIESELAQMVLDAGCGAVVAPGDPRALARSIMAFYSNRAQLAVCAQKARAYSEAKMFKKRGLNAYVELCRRLVT